jgi:hypothetical protein
MKPIYSLMRSDLFLFLWPCRCVVVQISRYLIVKLGACDTNYHTEWASRGYVSTAEKAATAGLNHALRHHRGVEVDNVNWPRMNQLSHLRHSTGQT